MTTERPTTPGVILSEAFPDPTAARLRIVEAALFVSPEPLSIDQLKQLFDPSEKVTDTALRDLLLQLQTEAESRGVMLVEVASGWRYQTRSEFQPWLVKLQEDKPRRYGRALLETLALIAYRQPITRGEIEQVRGVAVATSVMRTLLDRHWIQPVGRRDIPGRPITFGTTANFLNDFGLQQLSDLPSLTQIKSMAELDPGFDFNEAPESETTFAQILGGFQPESADAVDDDFDEDLAERWQRTDAMNAAFTDRLNAMTDADPEDTTALEESSNASTTGSELAMTEREVAELIAQKTREQQEYLEKSNQQNEHNDD